MPVKTPVGTYIVLPDGVWERRKKGYDIMRADMKNLEQRGLLLPADKDAALGRITLVESHAECVRANLIVEAIFEDLEAKRVLFKELDAAAVKEGTDPILSTNSINFSIGSIVKKGATGSSRCHPFKYNSPHLEPSFCIRFNS